MHQTRRGSAWPRGTFLGQGPGGSWHGQVPLLCCVLTPRPVPGQSQSVLSGRPVLRGAVPASLLLLARPTFCSLTPLQDTAREAFAFPLFTPGGRLSSPRAVLLLCSRHKPARQGPSPSPTPAFQRQVHLAGCPAPPALTPLPGLRVVAASIGRPDVGDPFPKTCFCDQGGCPSWPPSPGQGLTPTCCLGKCWGGGG